MAVYSGEVGTEYTWYQSKTVSMLKSASLRSVEGTIPSGMNVSVEKHSATEVRVYLYGTPTQVYSGTIQVQFQYTFGSFQTQTNIETRSFEITITQPSYTVSLTAGAGGSVSGGGTYTYGSSVTISATPDAGYEFEQWSDGDTNATRTITVTGNVTLSASFKLGIAQIPVKVSGAWTDAEASVKVGGSWVPVKKVYMKVNGTWKEKI